MARRARKARACGSWALAQPWTGQRWRKFERDYRREMRRPEAQHLLEVLARLSRQTNFSIGCYCENASRCHRSILKRLLVEKNGVCP